MANGWEGGLTAAPLGSLPPVGFKGEAWFLWCPNHGTFWGDDEFACCGCGYQTNEMTEIRKFKTGASRDTEIGKLDYEAFLSPAVLHRYAQFMHKNRQLLDGSLRDGDNWQKGIPRGVYIKSLFRHFMDVWLIHRTGGAAEALQESLCAMMFNTMGYLFEELRDDREEED